MGYITEDLLVGRKGDWESDAFQLTFYSIALGMNAQLVYEIGLGQSTLGFIRVVQRTGGLVVTCDHNDEHPLGLAWLKMGLPWEWSQLRSDHWIETLKDQADVIFIDGTHTYSSVKQDIKGLWPFLRPDGLMLLHDTRSWAGVGTVLAEIKAAGTCCTELPYCQGVGVIHKCGTMELGI